MTPERIADIRRRSGLLDMHMAHYAKLHPVDQAEVLAEAFNAAKTVPQLLDEIERLQALTAAPPPAATEEQR